MYANCIRCFNEFVCQKRHSVKLMIGTMNDLSTALPLIALQRHLYH